MGLFKTVSVDITDDQYQNYLNMVHREINSAYPEINLDIETIRNHPGIRNNFISQIQERISEFFGDDLYGIYPAQAFAFFKEEIEEAEIKQRAKHEQAKKELEEHGAKIYVPANKIRKARALLIAAGVIEADNTDVDLNIIDLVHETFDPTPFDDSYDD